MVVVAEMYRFTPFSDPAALKGPLARVACANGVRGTILLAPEGINATIAGARAGIDAVMAHVRGLPGCADLACRESAAETQPFGKLRVRVKPEIVTMGRPGVDPRGGVGRYVAPRDWNALVTRDDVALIDTRNAYEVAIGTFTGALDPGTASFRDFPAWWEANADRFAGRTVAMFCTGGIRCEKSTNWLLSRGVADVVHLKGGILRYLAEVPEACSLWHGACFVFDGRVSVGAGLRPGGHALCHACRRPVGAADMVHPAYEAGVRCPACRNEYTDADRARFRERMRQIRLARARGTRHLRA